MFNAALSLIARVRFPPPVLTARSRPHAGRHRRVRGRVMHSILIFQKQTGETVKRHIQSGVSPLRAPSAIAPCRSGENPLQERLLFVRRRLLGHRLSLPCVSWCTRRPSAARTGADRRSEAHGGRAGPPISATPDSRGHGPKARERACCRSRLRVAFDRVHNGSAPGMAAGDRGGIV